LRDAEAEASRARDRRDKQRDRLAELTRKGAVDQGLLDEEKDRLRSAQAEARLAEARLAQARAYAGAREASVREAEARFERSAAVARNAPASAPARDPKAVEAAKARLALARVDRMEAEMKAARADSARAEADLEGARASLTYRTKQRERIKQLVDRGAVEMSQLEEVDQRLNEARRDEQVAEAAAGSAKARLEATRARVDAEVGALAPPARPRP
jgi:multidrug resistance efflux pump